MADQHISLHPSSRTDEVVAGEEAAHARQLAMIARLTSAERIERALALSSFIRQVALAGARRIAGPDEKAVRERFLTQLYSAEMTPSLRALLDRL